MCFRIRSSAKNTTRFVNTVPQGSLTVASEAALADLAVPVGSADLTAKTCTSQPAAAPKVSTLRICSADSSVVALAARVVHAVPPGSRVPTLVMPPGSGVLKVSAAGANMPRRTTTFPPARALPCRSRTRAPRRPCSCRTARVLRRASRRV